jgi:hypothetical protein
MNPSTGAYIDTPAWDETTLEKARKRYNELYEVSLENWKKDLGVKDPLIETIEEVLEKN